MKNFTLVRSLIIATFAVAFLFSAGFAANEVKLVPGAQNSLSVNESSYARLQVTNTVNDLNFLEVTSSKGLFEELLVPGYSKTNTAGDPQLPVLSKLIEIPADATPEVKVLSYDVKEYNLADWGIVNKLFPTQPPQPKNREAGEIVFNASTYALNQFTGGELATVEVSGYLRGVRLGNLVISPIQYNPVTNTIRVYNNLVVDVRFTGANLSKTTGTRALYDSPYFRSIYKDVINLQPVTTDSRDTLSKPPIKYVIVSDPMFQAQLQPFIQWKTKKGFTVVEAYTDDPAVGNTFNSIKAYLQGLYTSATPDDPAPTFVLFVGDVDQVPAYNCGAHVSDLYYCEYNGDYLPEVYYGRFSATSTSELQPQIDKTLEYEQYLMPDPSFLGECVMVAGHDPSYGPLYGNGQINYGTTYYFNEAHGLLSHTYLQPEPSGGNYAQNIRSNVSDGVAFANYTAHGSPSGWADPSFSINDVANLQNAHKYPLMVGNCCQSSTYNQNCFGEALLRAQNKGAVGYIGASDYSYWDEDFYWGVGTGPIVVNPTYETTGLGSYDRTFHDHGEPMTEWYSTQDQMVFAGNLAVQASNSGMKQYYWEAYCLMGDPSLMIYYSVPPAMQTTYAPLLPLGSADFEIETEPYAYIAITRNNVIHGVAEADENGHAVMSIIPFTDPGYADIVITKQNFQPFIDSVLVASPEGPYLLLNSYQFNDDGGNNNQLPEFGEPLDLNLTVVNYGNAAAVNTLATISTTDPYLTVTEPTFTWPLIPSQQTESVSNVFGIDIADYLPDMHQANLTLTLQADTAEFTYQLPITLYAPLLQADNITIDDAAGGNGNGIIEPGETIQVYVNTENVGHCASSDVLAQMAYFGAYITGNTQIQNLGPIAAGGSAIANYSFTVSPDAPLGYEFSMYYVANSGPYNVISGLYLTVGQQIEDFETGTLSKYNWKFAGSAPWTIDNSVKYEGSYSARSGNIANSQKSEMYLDVNVITAGNISFYRKVSSEQGYDFLRFYIDDQLQGEWSGNSDWAQVTYAVTTGPHKLRWAYEKDEASIAFQDAAWVDYIMLPPFSENQNGPLNVYTTALPSHICAGTSSQLYVFATGGWGTYNYSWSPAASLNNPTVFNPVASPSGYTLYSVVVTSGTYSMTDYVEVFVDAAPTTPEVTISGDHLVSTPAYSYQWYDGDGIIQGATQQTYTPEHSNFFYVITGNAAGCNSEPSNQVYYGFTGTGSQVSSGLQVYPNPFAAQLKITYNATGKSNVRITLYDALGSEVAVICDQTMQQGVNTITWDGSSLPAGIYTCKVIEGSNSVVTKLIHIR
jgi:hypothetical protein